MAQNLLILNFLIISNPEVGFNNKFIKTVFMRFFNHEVYSHYIQILGIYDSSFYFFYILIHRYTYTRV